MRPELLAATRIDHQRHSVANRLASRLHQQFVRLVIPSTKRTPTQLDRPKTAIQGRFQRFSQLCWLVEQHRTIRLDPVAVNSAKQTRNRLTTRLAHQVPQSNVDPTDRVLNCTATTLPECRFPQHVGHPLGLNRRLALQQRPQQLDRTLDQLPRRETTAHPHQAVLGRHPDQGVQVLLGFQVLRPAAVDRGTGQCCQFQFDNSHRHSLAARGNKLNHRRMP